VETVTQLVDEIMQKEYHVTSVVRNRQTHGGAWYFNFHQKADGFLKNMKTELHAPFAGIILFRFKGTFSAHLTTVKAMRPLHCREYRHPWCNFYHQQSHSDATILEGAK